MIHPRSLVRQAGLTLVEVLVALTLMLVVTLATVALYNVNSSGSRTVDASQEIEDTARFAMDTIGNAIRNAGYREFVPLGGGSSGLATVLYDGCNPGTEPCPILGFERAATSQPTGGANTNFGTVNTVAAGANNSDLLAVRFFGSGTGATGDGSITDCLGVGVPASIATNPAGGRTDLGLSMFWVRPSTRDGEPELVCTRWNTATSVRDTQPLVRGVETFQVMYGLDTGGAGLPTRWVSATDVTNWQQVLAVRVGMVLRGAPGSAQAPDTTTLYPMGQGFIGTLTETGLSFTPPADNRLRRTFVSTFMLRNRA